MADTLSEIYNDTLVESDFNSSGEATIVTTDSSTSHVIKNVQAIDTDTQVPINGTLEVNGFDVVSLTANSSGSEIIAPSSTVKVKTNTFPLQYVDYELAIRTGGTNYISHKMAKVNGIQVINEIYDATNTTGANITISDTRDTYAPFIGPNNYHFIAKDNNNSSTQAYIYNEINQIVWSATTSYTPKWFDGKHYAYFYTSSTSPYSLRRVDIRDATETQLIAQDMGAPSTYPNMFGFEDEYVWFWSNHNEACWVWDIANETASMWCTSSMSTTLTQSDRGWYAVKRSNGSFRFVIPTGQSTLRYYDYTFGDVFNTSTNQPTYNEVQLSGNKELIRENAAKHAPIGSRLYYINNDSEKIAYVDFETDEPTKGVVGTNQITQGYGNDLTAVERTPDAATIAGRTYGISPSLKLRMTGVTST